MTAISLPSREEAAQLGLAVAAGILLGGAIATGSWLLPAAVALVAALALAFLYLETAMLVLCVAALVQIPLVELGPVSSPTLIELAVPLAVVAMAMRSLTARSLSTVAAPAEGVARTPTAVKAVNASLALFAVVVLANLLRSATSPDLGQDVGLGRVFYAYAIALAVYPLVYTALVSGALRFRRLLATLFALAVVISVVGVLAVALGVPLSLGNLRYSVVDYASGAVRVGFLETAGIVGIALVAVRKLTPWRAAAALLFAAALLASGGRAAVLGALVALAAYLVLSGKGLRFALAALLAGLAVWALPVIEASPQVERLSDVGSRSFEAGGRAYIYNESVAAFADNPLTGTGLGAPVAVFETNRELASFYASQLLVGGHATYAALLKNFGLTGLLPFLAALLAALLGLASRARSDPLAAFFFIFLLAESIVLIVSGNGSDPVYYLALGGGAAAMARPRRPAASPLPEAGSGGSA